MNEKGNAVADAPTLLHSERAEAERTQVSRRSSLQTFQT